MALSQPMGTTYSHFDTPIILIPTIIDVVPPLSIYCKRGFIETAVILGRLGQMSDYPKITSVVRPNKTTFTAVVYRVSSVLDFYDRVKTL